MSFPTIFSVFSLRSLFHIVRAKLRGGKFTREHVYMANCQPRSYLAVALRYYGKTSVHKRHAVKGEKKAAALMNSGKKRENFQLCECRLGSHFGLVYI